MVTRVEGAVRAKLATPPAPRINWSPRAPTDLDDNNRFLPGPIYCLSDVQGLVEVNGVLVVNDSAQEAMRCEGDEALPKPVWRSQDVVSLILSLQGGDYINSQWCLTGPRMKLDCDAYASRYCRIRGRWPHAEKIYVKFGFSQNTGSSTALVCSVHRAQR